MYVTCSGIMIVLLATLALCLTSIHGYFWQYDYETQTCSPRESVMEGGPFSLWSVWSWVTEMLVFGAVPLTILVLNFCVIVEIGRVMRKHRDPITGRQLSQSPPVGTPICFEFLQVQ